MSRYDYLDSGQRRGECCLLVPMDKEKAFRNALNGIGYGMPQV
jgi:hypothetical protein